MRFANEIVQIGRAVCKWDFGLCGNYLEGRMNTEKNEKEKKNKSSIFIWETGIHFLIYVYASRMKNLSLIYKEQTTENAKSKKHTKIITTTKLNKRKKKNHFKS